MSFVLWQNEHKAVYTCRAFPIAIAKQIITYFSQYEIYRNQIYISYSISIGSDLNFKKINSLPFLNTIFFKRLWNLVQCHCTLFTKSQSQSDLQVINRLGYGEKLCGLLNGFRQACYDLNLRRRNLIQGHSTSFTERHYMVKIQYELGRANREEYAPDKWCWTAGQTNILINIGSPQCGTLKTPELICT